MSPPAIALSADPAADLAAMRARVQGRNINPDSLLATDYLNHFNEVIMLLGMVPDMPECLDDAKAWQPKDYAQHFRDSGFTDKELAIAAYELSPAEFREPFDRTIALMDELVARGIRQIELCLDRSEALAATVRMLSQKLQLLMDVATASINGRNATMGQAEIDQIMGAFDGHGTEIAPAADTAPAGNQDAIDALFDDAPAKPAGSAQDAIDALFA